MDKQNLYVIIGSLAGVLLGVFLAGYSVNNQNYGMMNMMGMRSGVSRMMQTQPDDFSVMSSQGGHGMDMSMNQMSSLLATLRGDEFDEAFLVQMIDHHQGAIDMAELVLLNSERAELTELANNIISAQASEIERMQGWLNDWFGK